MLRKRRLGVVILLLIAALLMVACGSSNETAASESTETDQVTEAEPGHSDGDEHAAGADHHAAEAEHSHGDEDHHDEGGDMHAHEMTHEPIAGAKEIRVVAKEWGFEPASLHLRKDEPVNIVLVNEGALEHEVELEAFEFHVHAQPGETVSAGFVPDKSGEFEFGCFVSGHYEAGMVGEVIVEEAHAGN
ncbi:MAG TPA: cupredoxin domain-containing protein [Candidatus Binatia bacterium]|jgi:plastocyanin|nr:cupredoxin domain-containing protein [Candidatus Binatia bacterium]